MDPHRIRAAAREVQQAVPGTTGPARVAQRSVTARQTDCGTLTVNPAFSADDVSVQNCSISSSTVTEGGSVQIGWELVNDGNAEATVDWELRIGGQAVETGSRSLNPGSPQTASVTVNPTDAGLSPGDHAVELDLSATEASARRSATGLSRVFSLGSCGTCG